MARARFENLAPERREAILAAAAEEFATHGYTGASLSRIIEAAKISKGALYYYFDDKADLFGSVLKAAMDRMVEDIGWLEMEGLDRSNFWETVRSYGRETVSLMRKDTWYVRLGMAFYRFRDEPEAAPLVEPAMNWSRGIMRSMLERGRELGVVRSDLPLDLLVETGMAVDEAGGRWLTEHMSEYDEAGVEGLIDAQIDLMRDMLDAENEGWEK